MRLQLGASVTHLILLATKGNFISERYDFSKRFEDRYPVQTTSNFRHGVPIEIYQKVLRTITFGR